MSTNVASTEAATTRTTAIHPPHPQTDQGVHITTRTGEALPIDGVRPPVGLVPGAAVGEIQWDLGDVGQSVVEPLEVAVHCRPGAARVADAQVADNLGVFAGGPARNTGNREALEPPVGDLGDDPLVDLREQAIAGRLDDGVMK